MYNCKKYTKYPFHAADFYAFKKIIWKNTYDIKYDIPSNI